MGLRGAGTSRLARPPARRSRLSQTERHPALASLVTLFVLMGVGLAIGGGVGVVLVHAWDLAGLNHVVTTSNATSGR
ncbi:MAG: hypothetical protein ACXVXC_07835 [Nocardioidaceae bacterium]